MSVTTGGRRNNHTEVGVADPFIRRGYWVRPESSAESGALSICDRELTASRGKIEAHRKVCGSAD